MGDADGNEMGRYAGMVEIWGTTCPIGFKTRPIGDRTCRIEGRMCRIGYGKLTVAHEILMMISPISSHLHLPSLSFSSTNLPSPENTEFSHPSLPPHVMIKS
jgi:hypothetical protein